MVKSVRQFEGKHGHAKWFYSKICIIPYLAKYSLVTKLHQCSQATKSTSDSTSSSSSLSSSSSSELSVIYTKDFYTSLCVLSNSMYNFTCFTIHYDNNHSVHEYQYNITFNNNIFKIFILQDKTYHTSIYIMVVFLISIYIFSLSFYILNLKIYSYHFEYCTILLPAMTLWLEYLHLEYSANPSIIK